MEDFGGSSSNSSRLPQVDIEKIDVLVKSELFDGIETFCHW